MWKSIVLLSANVPKVTSLTRTDVLHLYRNLLKGGRTFKYTDKQHYTKRVREEFKNNAKLDKGKSLEVYRVFPTL
jgi:hypothetical protein